MRELFVAAFWLAAVSTATTAAINWRRRRDSSVYGVVFCMGAGVALVNLLSGLCLLAPTRTSHWLSVSVLNVCQSVVVGAVACMALVLSDRAWRISRRTFVLLSIEPAALLALTATNPWHHLLFADFTPLDDRFVAVPGTLYWLNVLYVQALLWGTAARVLDIRRRATSLTQHTVCTRVLLTNVPPLIAGFAASLLPVPIGDLIPLGQAVTMIYIQLTLINTVPRQVPVAHQQVFSAIADAVTVVDRTGRIIEVNPAAHALSHRLHPELPDDLTGLVMGGFDKFDLHENRTSDQILTDVSGSGIDLHLLINPLFDQQNACIGWALVARDITEANRGRRQAEETAVQLREQLRTVTALQANLAEQATRDELTGLHNRRYLVRILGREVPRTTRGLPLSLALIDLDHFKDINDTFGHGAGDLVLINVAHLLASTVRQDDVVARYGGEEFVIVFRGASAATAWSRTDALRERLRRTPLQVDELSLSVTFSAGVAELSPGRSGEELLRAADAALYRAKRQGRDRVILAAESTPDARIRPQATSGHDLGSASRTVDS
jgi:diguanylate cyclase (GGDEF)-like protein